MFTKSIKKKFVKQFLLQTPPALNLKNKNFSIDVKFYPYLDDNNNVNNVHNYINNFGECNKDKIFYVIKRSPGTGLFSNVTFVLNHLINAKKMVLYL